MSTLRATLSILGLLPSIAFAQSPRTQIVMLGTGIMVLFIVLIIGHLAYVGLAKLIGK